MKIGISIVFSYYLIPLLGCTIAWGSDKIKLTDLKTITLYSGKMTNGRRTAPVPQLHCTGGSAGCSFVPHVVQCYNKGFDGYDVQWECKTDMDNAYRFGTIEVTCEGYDYPDDPYILKGSCGLRYTIDYTKEGQKQNKGHDYGYGNSNYNYSRGKSGLLADVITLIIVVVIIYAIIKTCLHRNQYSTTDDDHPDNDSRYFSGGFRSASPPPPGFRTDYTSSGSCGTPGGTTSGGGGFWTGAMTGGLLGYMFGSRGNQGQYSSRGTGYWNNSSIPRQPFGTSSSWTEDSSTGTRNASGYGGTTRR